jgi:uncharacterized protein (DUF2147 family)
MRLAIIATVLALAAGPALAADPVEGDWMVGTTRVRIAPCPATAERLCGVIVAVKPAAGRPSTDVHNPDPKLRARPILGLSTLTGFSGSGGDWSGGRAYDPKSGKSYRSTLKLNPDGSLNVSGCVFFICESRRWTRVR